MGPAPDFDSSRKGASGAYFGFFLGHEEVPFLKNGPLEIKDFEHCRPRAQSEIGGAPTVAPTHSFIFGHLENDAQNLSKGLRSCTHSQMKALEELFHLVLLLGLADFRVKSC